MLTSLVLFLVYSIPPLAGWWICFRAPFGRRRLRRAVVVPAAPETVWRALDPRAPTGGWSLLYETQSVTRLRESPLILAFERRPRHSARPYAIVEEECTVDEAAVRITRQERQTNGAFSEISLSPAGEGTRISVVYERRTVGLLDDELTRLALARDLDALQDAVLGRDAKEAPLFRFSGWRLATLGVVSGVVMVALILIPAFYVSLSAMGVSIETLLAEPASLAFVLGLVAAAALFLAALLIVATLVHEIGHALALAAFGHRGVTVSLIPFGGGIALGARDYASAFEAGVVSLSGLALSAIAASAVMPDPARLSALMQGLLSPTPDYAGLLIALGGAVFVLLTLLVNIPNALPWTGSDGALTLGAIFADRRARQIAAGLFAALLAYVFAGVDDLLPFALMFLALGWFNRNRPEPATPTAPQGWRPFAVAASLALVVCLYAHEAAALRRIEWTVAPTLPAEQQRT